LKIFEVGGGVLEGGLRRRGEVRRGRGRREGREEGQLGWKKEGRASDGEIVRERRASKAGRHELVPLSFRP